jgi:hypothetical protein
MRRPKHFDDIVFGQELVHQVLRQQLVGCVALDAEELA